MKKKKKKKAASAIFATAGVAWGYMVIREDIQKGACGPDCFTFPDVSSSKRESMY